MSLTLAAFTRVPGYDLPTLPDPSPNSTSLELESPINAVLRLNCFLRNLWETCVPVLGDDTVCDSEEKLLSLVQGVDTNGILKVLV